MGVRSPRICAGHSMLCPYRRDPEPVGGVRSAGILPAVSVCAIREGIRRLEAGATCMRRHRAGERGEGVGIEIRDGASEFGVVLGAAREEERVEAVEVGEEGGGGAGLVGRGERFAVRVRVVPGLAEVGIGVECCAEIVGLGSAGFRVRGDARIVGICSAGFQPAVLISQAPQKLAPTSRGATRALSRIKAEDFVVTRGAVGAGSARMRRVVGEKSLRRGALSGRRS